MVNSTLVLDSISREIHNCRYDAKEIKKAIDNFKEDMNDKNTEIIYEAARCIVEPMIENEIVNNEYVDFQENDKQNWANFIRHNFGEIWGKIADIINENGY